MKVSIGGTFERLRIKNKGRPVLQKTGRIGSEAAQ